MTKAQIIAELRRLGLSPRAKSTKGALEIMLRGAQSVEEKIRNAKIVRMPKPKPMPEKVFGEPRPADQVTPARAGTKRALILDALHKGCTIDDLMKVTGWNRPTCHSAIQTDVVKGNGLGVRRNADGVLHLVLPKGMKRPPIVGADETRAAAVVAACK